MKALHTGIISLLTFCSIIATAQGVVQGYIKTTDTYPAASVTIQLKETTKYAVTGDTGFYQLQNIREGGHALFISLPGVPSQNKSA